MTNQGRAAGHAHAGGDADTRGDQAADVEIGGSFRAAGVTFRELSGLRSQTDPEQAGGEEDHVRENVPHDPSTGRAYRDVYVRRRVGARLGVDVAGGSSEGRTHGD